MDSEGKDIEVLQVENQKLKKHIRDLVIQKNRMEDSLYRAFHRLHNAKKRKISQLEKELVACKRRKGDAEDGDVSTTSHCDTCRCGVDQSSEEMMGRSHNNRKKLSARRISDSDDEADPQGPGSGYGSETDVDDLVIPDSQTSPTISKISNEGKGGKITSSSGEPSGSGTSHRSSAPPRGNSQAAPCEGINHIIMLSFKFKPNLHNFNQYKCVVITKGPADPPDTSVQQPVNNQGVQPVQAQNQNSDSDSDATDYENEDLMDELLKG